MTGLKLTALTRFQLLWKNENQALLQFLLMELRFYCNQEFLYQDSKLQGLLQDEFLLFLSQENCHFHQHDKNAHLKSFSGSHEACLASYNAFSGKSRVFYLQ